MLQFGITFHDLFFMGGEAIDALFEDFIEDMVYFLGQIVRQLVKFDS